MVLDLWWWSFHHTCKCQVICSTSEINTVGQLYFSKEKKLPLVPKIKKSNPLKITVLLSLCHVNCWSQIFLKLRKRFRAWIYYGMLLWDHSDRLSQFLKETSCLKINSRTAPHLRTPVAPTLPSHEAWYLCAWLSVFLLKVKFLESRNKTFLFICISLGLAQELVCPLHSRNISWMSWLNHSNHLFQMWDEAQTGYLPLSAYKRCWGWWWLIRGKMVT